MRQLLAAAVLALAACGPMGEAEGVDDELSTSQLGLSLGAADSATVLEYVNYPGTAVGILDNDVQLDARAAKAIVARKNGPDGRELTADDRPFTSIADLDAVPYVGDLAIGRILAFAKANPIPQGVTVENVAFTGWQAEAVLWGANTVPVGVLNGLLDNRAAANVIAGRPYFTMKKLADVPLVGPNALQAMRGQAKVWWNAWKWGGTPVTPPPPASSLAGTFDGVSFDEVTAAAALKLANGSTREVMVANGVPAAPAAAIVGNRPYASVAQIAAVSGVGTSTMQALHRWASAPAVDPVAQLKAALEPVAAQIDFPSETDARMLFVSASGVGTAPITEALIRATLTAQHDALLPQVMWVDPAQVPLATRTAVEQRDALLFLNRIIDNADPYDDASLAQARHLAQLRDLMTSQLTDLTVYRFGTVNISVFIVGRTSNGALAGLLTGQVET